MPFRPTWPRADVDPASRIDAQRRRIAELEVALWQGVPDDALLGTYQAAFRGLESLVARQRCDRRHRFIVVIPVADSPQQLHHCLDSLLQQCQVFGYGGRHRGRFRKVSVLLADDSADPVAIARNREIAADVDRAGIDILYFGADQQLDLIDRLAGVDLRAIIGEHPRDAFGHKGQGVMRNIAYLKLAEISAQRPDEPLLFYTIDADQEFRVRVETPDGGRSLCAINYLYEFDRLFSTTDTQVATGKVVGDPPVSPAVMAGRFLGDLIAFLREMAGSDPRQTYRQPDPAGAAGAAYHDMADLFGFASGEAAFRYRCTLSGAPSDADCLDDFARRLNSFLHGEHPTRVTWYHHRPAMQSVQPARTVYTGNYVFNRAALASFIPFAPLRLRMSGPTMGRLLRAQLGAHFVSVNLPMAHRRTLPATGRSEFRPGVAGARQTVDLCDEFERQLYGDVLLFAIERLAGSGDTQAGFSPSQVAATLDAVHAEMQDRYRARQAQIGERLHQARGLVHDATAWWVQDSELSAAVDLFDAFLANMAHNFGAHSPCFARIAGSGNWQRWRACQLQAIGGLAADRRQWRAAIARLSGRATR